MIELTSNILAVEVPKDATDIRLNNTDYNHKSVLSGYTPRNGTFIKDILKEVSLIGVTPLSYETWCIQVFFDEYDKGYITHGDDIAILLESKGLDINKKYAIIKIEK